MLPVRALLDAFPEGLGGKRVLDVAAAPGGKSTALLAEGACVVANEPNVARCKVLVENLLRCGAMPWAAVTQMEGQKCGALYPNVFDAVLLDAPCSGESLTRKEGLEMLQHPPGYVEQLQLSSDLFRKLFSIQGSRSRHINIYIYE